MFNKKESFPEVPQNDLSIEIKEFPEVP